MISDVELSNGDSVISYSSEERPDVSQDETLAAVETAIEGANVVAATARIDSSRTVRCNFTAGVAVGKSNAMYYVTELADTAVPLLARLTHEELGDILAKTNSPVDAGQTQYDSRVRQ
jgi:hypothetical protein